MTSHLSPAGRIYVGAVVTSGIAVVVQSLVSLWSSPVSLQWFILAGLTLLSGSFTVRVPTIPARLSVSETFVFATVLLFGPAAATMIVVLDTLVISLWLRGASRSLSRILFNMAAPAVAIWIASHLFYALTDIEPLSREPQQILSLVLPLFGLALCYFLFNSALVARAVAFQKHLSAFTVWRQNFLWLSLNYFSGASVAALLLPYWQTSDSAVLRLIGVILPLLLISYLTFKTALGRVEDANNHLAELNRLYLSTIETLAMAIDAKDQITHGHIRRVQTYAVALAKEMGIADEKLIRAVEAAALLHDMGKLAVPEYILNKPGPLTPAEFEKMKLHASAGADILSSIAFPYPVVPIVRHHHESWNGTGYPDGLSGSSIPLGARILSVVDCFDALTSDRPYRPRLADREAIRILKERRGTMYDPLVVDTFIRLHPTLVAPPLTEDHPLATISRVTGELAGNTDRSLRLDVITASSSEVVALFALSHALGNQLKLAEVGSITFEHLRRLVPHSFGLMFVYIKEKDHLLAAYASGESASLLTGMTVAIGQRLTGWVAANRQAIRNSDPTLDLGEVAKSVSPRPRSCLSSPLLLNGDMVGVLTLYSTEHEFFSEEHERLLEAVSRQVAAAVSRAMEQRDDDGAAVHRRQAPGYDRGMESVDSLPDDTCLALIGNRSGLALDAGQAQSIVDALRPRDLVFRRGSNQLAILSEGNDIPSLRRIVLAALGADQAPKFVITSVPAGGRSFDQLLATADRLMEDDVRQQEPGPRSVH